MRVQISTYKFFKDYGFSWQFGKKFGNYTPNWLRPLAKVIHKFGIKHIINIKN